MDVFMYVLISTVSLLIDGISLLMLARAIFSWFPTENESKLQRVLFHMTEPFIVPVRKFLWRMNWFQGLPIDISFMITYLLLGLVRFSLMFAAL